MRPAVKLLLAGLAALTVAQLFAVYAESQLAAEASWLLVQLVACLALFALADAIFRRLGDSKRS